MLKSRASRLLGPYEYEIIFPVSKVGAGRKKSYIIQTNLNTTFQEGKYLILEEACSVQGYSSPSSYELIYEGQKLEREVNIRKSGLPISGVLDLVASANVEKETSVNVGLQLESGKRLAHKFDVQETIWNVLQYWESQGENIMQDKGEDVVPVCNYLRQTIIGKDELQEKTLRSIGLTRGSGVIRLNFRAASEVGNQAGVGSQFSVPANLSTNKPTAAIVPQVQATELVATPPVATMSILPSAMSEPLPQGMKKTFLAEEKEKVVAQQLHPTKAETSLKLAYVDSSDSVSNPSAEAAVKAVDSSQIVNQEEEPMDTINEDIGLQYATEGQLFVLGENQDVLYHGDDVRAPKVIHESDDFFEVTAKDVESIYRDLRAKRAELENQPLLTNSLRQADQQTMEEVIVTKYPATVVRIRFPDRYVLQGVFATTDYVSSLMAFVRRHLQNPDLNFYLCMATTDYLNEKFYEDYCFKAPPKTVLDGTKTLLQQNLLNLAIIYFGTDSKQERYFKEELYSQVSDPQEVFKNAGPTSSKTFVNNYAPAAQPATVTEKRLPESEPVAQNLPSSSQEPKNDSKPSTSNRPARTTNSGVVPKWFKTSK